MQEIYVSTDVETDGPIPGPHSMLSLGSAAFLADKQLVSSYSANLEPLPEATPHPETLAWWRTQPEAWEACRHNPRQPAVVMNEYSAWLEGLPGRPVFVGYPVTFDFMFVYWYLIQFTGRSPFSFSGIDIKSYAMALLGSEFRHAAKHHMPRRWFGNQEQRPHEALYDALDQGRLFCNMLQEGRNLEE